MFAVFESDHGADSRTHGKPQLESYDSGAEFSFSHWARVRALVNKWDVPLEIKVLSFVSRMVVH